MSHFNKTKEETTGTINLAGGTAYSETAKLEFASILLTSFFTDQYYRSAEETVTRMQTLMKSLDPKYVAQTALFARNEFGMRTVSHKVAADLAKDVQGLPWATSFYEKVVKRVDDMSEILAAYQGTNKKLQPLSNAMKKGFKKAFNKFEDYHLAKYQMKDKEISLVDIVNLVHPKPTKKNATALTALIKNELKQTETWNAALSAAGSDAKAKAKVWDDFVAKGNKIEYFALLRNIRNIFEQGSLQARSKALELLQDKNLIHKSKVLPFRFLTASRELAKTDFWRNVAGAFNNAMNISVDNIPALPGKTLIAVDTSASMSQALNKNSEVLVSDIAALFAAALYKKLDSEVLLFDRETREIDLNPGDSVSTIANSISKMTRSAGTDFSTIFAKITTENKAYDRIIVLSDMQSWAHSCYSGDSDIKRFFRIYKRDVSKDVKFYSMDLAGNGSLLLPERNVFTLAGFSEKVFDLFSLLEEDKNALVHKIESIEL